MVKLAAAALVLTACAGAPRKAPPSGQLTPPPSSPEEKAREPLPPQLLPTPEARRPPEPQPEPEPPPAPLEPPPWAAGPIDPKHVLKVYLTEYGKADNRSSCPLFVLIDHGVGAGAQARRADFAGGWAVAYDKKGQRSLFGVAGTGLSKGGGPEWPRQIRWSDGSKAGYGPEGGTGPKSIAYVEAQDADCLYNVWSAIGEAHLEVLLKGLRRVSAPAR